MDNAASHVFITSFVHAPTVFRAQTGAARRLCLHVSVIAFADAALYRAKRIGRNRVVGAVAATPTANNLEFSLIDPPADASTADPEQ